MATTYESSNRPTIIVRPDSRFATSFLSTKYRDHAVNGEALMDKTSGELFFKRESDGKIVSFYQNKKLISDLVIELRILLANNQSFEYPYDDGSAFFVSSNYDLIAINNESLYDLTTDDVFINNGPEDINKLSFKISGRCNGFFCRNSTRDVDKAIIEFLTNQYDYRLKNYNGNDSEFLAEKNKYNTNIKWENSNAILTYDIIVTKNGVNYEYLNNIEYINTNEDNCILFDNTIFTTHGYYDYATVIIKSITYDKIHFMINHKDSFDTDFIEAYNKLIHSDNRIEVAEFNVNHFIDNANDIIILGNESIISFVDIENINRYMSKMSKLTNASSVITTISEPSDSVWLANTLWAERIRDVDVGGVITDTGSRSLFSEIEEFYSSRGQNTVIGEMVAEDYGIIDEEDFPIYNND